MFDAANHYISRCSWKDLALVKFCLFSIGLVCGLTLKGRARKIGFWAATAAFVAAYIPLMAGFLPYLLKKDGGAMAENSCKNLDIGV